MSQKPWTTRIGNVSVIALFSSSLSVSGTWVLNISYREGAMRFGSLGDEIWLPESCLRRPQAMEPPSRLRHRTSTTALLPHRMQCSVPLSNSVQRGLRSKLIDIRLILRLRLEIYSCWLCMGIRFLNSLWRAHIVHTLLVASEWSIFWAHLTYELSTKVACPSR
jgi:hypothetical protein